jgi:hypothetical protein
MKISPFITVLFLFVTISVQAQSARSSKTQDPRPKGNSISEANTEIAATLDESSEKPESAGYELLQLQQAEVTKLNSSLAQLRQLYVEGLIAKVELDKAEDSLKAAQTKVEVTQNQIARAAKLAEETKQAAALPKFKPLTKSTLLPINSSSSPVLRSTAGSWSITNLSSVQQFFQQTFGRPLPMSAVGQSSTHDRLGWDHHNAVDVGLNPSSVEGNALINYLQQAGIPFLAFRSAIPGVATGPHIHIGFPSHPLG